MEINPIYERFLIAHNNNIVKAKKAYDLYILWKNEYANKIRRVDINHLLKTKQIYHYGSHNGYPICYAIIDNTNDFSNDDKIRYIVYVFERILEKHNEKKLIWIVEFSKITINKTTRQLLEKIVKVLSNNYPELLHKLYILNMPWYINFIKPIILFLMEKNTRDKIIFTPKDSLSKYIDKENLSIEYNGILEINDEIKENLY
jgi:hypothetical protein